jgi:hypothetical protein
VGWTEYGETGEKKKRRMTARAEQREQQEQESGNCKSKKASPLPFRLVAFAVPGIILLTSQ